MEKRILKGGSLSGTYLITTEQRQFVRKTVSLSEDREYGFQRWYSQLKRIQRYNQLFPGLFPTLLDTGVEAGRGFFDIEYYPTAVNCHDYICQLTEEQLVRDVLDQIVNKMDWMHSREFNAPKGSLLLYIEEEIKAKFHWCRNDPEFNSFYEYKKLYLNGEEIEPIGHVLDKYIEFGRKNYENPVESFTHGNITLENMLFIEDEGRIVFIDPYDENYVDSKHNEYSQILQSSNSWYELFNEGSPDINGAYVDLKIHVPDGLKIFNNMFTEFLNRRCTKQEILLIRFFEISQFTRMLPFKMAIDKPKMFFFYALASKLFQETQ